jgi:hypothetical protein
VTDQWGLRPGQEAEQPAPDVEEMVHLGRSKGTRSAQDPEMDTFVRYAHLSR